MKFEKDTVYTLRLANGDEWVTKIDREEGDYIYLTKPAAVMMGAQGAELFAAFFTADYEREVEINKSHVVGKVPAKTKVAEEYITATTGIVTPQKKIIMG